MNPQTVVALVAGTLFGAGLAISGMADPERVRAFLDVAGHWDPTLAFVMGGALIPMVVAWWIKRKLTKPLVAPLFDLPGTSRLDMKLFGGAAIFGFGWGIVGLCPGPAIADLAIHPRPALLFVGAMFGGMLLYRGCRMAIPYLTALRVAAETETQ